MDIYVGCRTDVPNLDPYFYWLEMTVEEYPTQDQAEALKDFLQPTTVEIIDEVVFVLDARTGELIWTTE